MAISTFRNLSNPNEYKDDNHGDAKYESRVNIKILFFGLGMGATNLMTVFQKIIFHTNTTVVIFREQATRNLTVENPKSKGEITKSSNRPFKLPKRK